MSKNYSLRIEQDSRYRFLVAIFLFFFCSFHSVLTSLDNLLWSLLLFGVYTLFFGYGYVISKRNAAGFLFHIFLMALDAVVVTLAVSFTEGEKSPLYILYVVFLGISLQHRSLMDFLYRLFFSLTLYTVLLIRETSSLPHLFMRVNLQLLLLLSLTGVLYVMLRRTTREWRMMDRLVSRAKTTVQISEVLLNWQGGLREKLRAVSKLLEQEIEGQGLQCRISLHHGKDHLLPPLYSKDQIQIPISDRWKDHGIMIITPIRSSKVSPEEADFFTTVSHSLGLWLGRTRAEKALQELEEKSSVQV